MNTHPNDEKPYSEEEVARARELIPEDDIGEATNFCYGTQVVYVENVVLLLCAALRTSSQPATPASASEAECALGGSHDWRGDGLCDRCGATLHQPPSGEWVMVPRVATEAMLVGGLKEADPIGELIDWKQGVSTHEDPTSREDVQAVYRAMIAAAPPADG